MSVSSNELGVVVVLVENTVSLSDEDRYQRTPERTVYRTKTNTLTVFSTRTTTTPTSLYVLLFYIRIRKYFLKRVNPRGGGGGALP